MEFFIEYSWAIAMIVALAVGVFTGYPVAFLLCGLGILFAIMSGIPLRFMGTNLTESKSCDVLCITSIRKNFQVPL